MRVEVVMTLGCVFVLMLADGGKPCTCANNLQDSSDGEDKQTHTGVASVCISLLELEIVCRISCYLGTQADGKRQRKVCD